MSIKTNSLAASHHSEQFSNSGNLLQEAGSINTGSTVSTSTAAIQAQESTVRIKGFAIHYQAIVERSARSIDILSENIITFDQQTCWQFGQQASSQTASDSGYPINYYG